MPASLFHPRRSLVLLAAVGLFGAAATLSARTTETEEPPAAPDQPTPRSSGADSPDEPEPDEPLPDGARLFGRPFLLVLGNLPSRLVGAGSEAAQLARLRMAANRQVMKKLQRAHDAVEKKEYGEGLHILQNLLDGPEDALCCLDPARPEQLSSLRGELERILGGLSRDAREAYEREFGATADALWQEARDAADPLLIGEVSRRFLQTRAGGDATRWLAHWHADHGRWGPAALCERRLEATADHSRAARLVALVGYLRASQEPQAQRLRATLSPGAPPPAANAWWTALAKSAEPNPSRAGLPPTQTVKLGRPAWSVSLLHSDELDFEQTAIGMQPVAWEDRVRRIRNDPAARQIDSEDDDPDQAAAEWLDFPAARPVIVGDRVVVRTIGNVLSRTIPTGDLNWETLPDTQFQQAALRLTDWPAPAVDAPGEDDPAEKIEEDERLRQFVLSRLWYETARGRLTADAERVFLVDDPLRPTGAYAMEWDDTTVEDGGVFGNRLTAVDVATGKRIWELGGTNDQAPKALIGATFPCAPREYQGRLYALARVGREFRLLVLEADTGRLVWDQAIAEIEFEEEEEEMLQFGEIEAAHFAAAVTESDGLIFCCMQGALVALDPLARSLLWMVRYDVETDEDVASRRDFEPVVVGGRIVVTPPDSTAVLCIDLVTGRVLWNNGRGEVLYIAAAEAGIVALVSRRRVEALRLSDGKPAWEHPEPIDEPSGYAAVRDGRLYVPRQDGEIQVLDLATGQSLARWTCPPGVAVGHLAFWNDKLLSQTVDRLECFDAPREP